MGSFGVPGDLSSGGIEEVRSRFPALQRREGGLPVAYFDGPGGTQIPSDVARTMAEYLFRHNANTHWAYPSSEETDAAIARSRQALADFVGGAPEEIAFGANMTTLTFHAARALGRHWDAGDEIVVTELDHHANIDPWRALERDRGMKVRRVAMRPETGELDMDDFERQMSRRTRLVAVGVASNALGTISDVAAVAKLARSHRALLFVDAVHSAPHLLTDVEALGCDLLACSAYKFYGPHIGILWGRRKLIDSLDPPRVEPAPSVAPEVLETGTQNHEGIVGAAAAVDFLASLGAPPGANRRPSLARAFTALERRSRELTQRLWNGMASIDGVRLYGPPPDRPRTPTVAFTLAGRSSEDVARQLARRGVFVSHGDFYAATVVRRLGLSPDGLVRAGCACYTTAEEVDRLVDGVREIAAERLQGIPA